MWKYEFRAWLEIGVCEEKCRKQTEIAVLLLRQVVCDFDLTQWFFPQQLKAAPVTASTEAKAAHTCPRRLQGDSSESHR